MNEISSSTEFTFGETQEEIQNEINSFMEFIFEQEKIQRQDLVDYTLEGKWNDVVDMYEKHAWTHTTTINDSQDTALHIAVDNRQEKRVAELVNAIVRKEGEKEPQTSGEKEPEKSAIATKNVRGDTPLHLAASRGFVKICYCIVGKNKERAHLLRVTNEKGENPLFLAALNRHKDAFLYLHGCFLHKTPAHLTRSDGNTILHCAIQREYFDLAVVIIHLHKELISCENKAGVTPLKMLADRPLAFKSSTNLGWLNKLLYHCILVEKVDVDTATKSPPDSALKFDVPDDTQKHHPENYETCYGFVRKLLKIAGLDERKQQDCSNFFITLPKIAASLIGFCQKKQQGDTENPKTQQEGDTKNSKTQEKNQKLESLPPNCETFWEFLKFLKSVYVSAAGLSGLGLSRVKGMKEKHEWSAQVLDLLMVEPSYAYISRGGDKPAWEREVPAFPPNQKTNIQARSGIPEIVDKIHKGMPIVIHDTEKANSQGKEKTKDEIVDKILKFMAMVIHHIEKTNSQGKEKTNDEIVDKIRKFMAMVIHDTEKTNDEDEIDKSDSPLLIAARNGITEIMDKILKHMPMVIHDTTSKYKRNILLAAVESRQPLLVETLKKHELWDNLILGVDTEENTALHLAARQSKYRAWQIPGSFMQMIWDIKWYQYIEDLVPHHFRLRTNQKGKTPPEIFEEEHVELVKGGSEWLKDTSESCSVVAALVAGVAFATSSAIPGGNNEETGKPIYEGQPAFNVFAITSLVALCFSVTALIMFLAILTSRKLAKDFRRDLPFKLLLGLSSLFISIASMLVAFCAAHFFVVKDKFKDILFPIYAATCLPVCFYAIAQFPLYIDLLTAILTKVPHP